VRPDWGLIDFVSFVDVIPSPKFPRSGVRRERLLFREELFSLGVDFSSQVIPCEQAPREAGSNYFRLLDPLEKRTGCRWGYGFFFRFCLPALFDLRWPSVKVFFPGAAEFFPELPRRLFEGRKRLFAAVFRRVRTWQTPPALEPRGTGLVAGVLAMWGFSENA